MKTARKKRKEWRVGMLHSFFNRQDIYETRFKMCPSLTFNGEAHSPGNYPLPNFTSTALKRAIVAKSRSQIHLFPASSV